MINPQQLICFLLSKCIIFFYFNWVLPAKSFELIGSSPSFVFFYVLLHYSVVILHCVDLWWTDLFLTSNKIHFDWLIDWSWYVGIRRQVIYLQSHCVCVCVCVRVCVRVMTAGQETAKQALQEIVILPALRPEVFARYSCYLLTPTQYCSPHLSSLAANWVG